MNQLLLYLFVVYTGLIREYNSPDNFTDIEKIIKESCKKNNFEIEELAENRDLSFVYQLKDNCNLNLNLNCQQVLYIIRDSVTNTGFSIEVLEYKKNKLFQNDMQKITNTIKKVTEFPIPKDYCPDPKVLSGKLITTTKNNQLIIFRTNISNIKKYDKIIKDILLYFKSKEIEYIFYDKDFYNLN